MGIGHFSLEDEKKLITDKVCIWTYKFRRTELSCLLTKGSAQIVL